ncbi:hypothetical protein PCANC_00502 [Puccinia coronata f. sp. avenae]|uniref:HAT C-terminal dimerisation domain-containing protein n=1 Tax=Puccinia coronata f. sp. avenae TaxID=200324 RepID=A0A2N5W848_9BASI|nr:hypothetical protein PCANC_00502 [Puccinia coronata f. sp. avenae]
MDASKNDEKQPGLTVFLKPTFVNRVLNQLLMMWQICQALPWSRIKDPFLRATFQFSNPKAVLYGRRWSADKAKKLYLVLKSCVFDELNNLNTQFTLIHDVWTTKGNRFAFIGAAAAYINDDWEYVTTDSGSNNNTMASSMYTLLHDGDGSTAMGDFEWDPTRMHIWCICHKLALIVNAGLAALSLKNLPPAKTKESVLGFFPVLGRLTKEEEPKETESKDGQPAAGVEVVRESNNGLVGLDIESDTDYGNADDEASETGEELRSQPEDDGAAEVDLVPNSLGGASRKHAKSTKLKDLTKKVAFLKLQLFLIKTLTLPHSLIQIRWNIKYQSYRKAVDAQTVIDHILKEDQLQKGVGVFEGIFFFPKDWQEIESLTNELKIFVQLTSEMEGNSATGAHVIPKYLELSKDLKEKISQSPKTKSLYPMYHTMLTRVENYLDEAMECRTLVLATLLHPCYRMHIFDLGFGLESKEAKKCLSLLQHEFRLEQEQQKRATTNSMVADANAIEITKPPSAPPKSIMAGLACCNSHQPTPQENEIKTYLKANLRFKKAVIDHKTTPLKWWKVNQMSYPTLAVMARAYLGAAGSSCAENLQRPQRL